MKKQDMLFDMLKIKLNVKSDVKLSEVLLIAPPILSKYRSGNRKIGSTAILQIHEVTNIDVKTLRELIQ